jgi:hypothetical protein
MWTDLVPVLLGFLLTTVIGGLFASFLQHRNWRNQNDVRTREEERARASDVCASLAAILDKRLYRMRRLYWATVWSSANQISPEDLKARLDDYQQVLFEWNDQLKARLATVAVYFGEDVRWHLDHVVYTAFKETGERLEGLYRQVNQDPPAPLDEAALADASAGIVQLSQHTYDLIFAMTIRIREGKVGMAAPELLRGEMPLTSPRTTA